MLRRTPFKRKSYEEIAAQWEKKIGKDRVHTTPLKKTTLKPKSDSPVAKIKDDIQKLIRDIVILRDGGCVLRNSVEAGPCHGWKKNGELILQAEHLISRSHSNTYGDTRNIVCLCRGHHGHFKPNNSLRYWQLIEQIVGPTRWTWIKRNEEEYTRHQTYKMDWGLVKWSLEKELATYESTTIRY